MKKVIFPIIGTAAALVIGTIFFLKNKNIFLQVKKCNLLKMEDVIAFFKNKDIKQRLEADSNLLAVAIKEYKNGCYRIICTLYDKTKEEIIDTNKYTIVFKAKDIDKDLKNAFLNKEMIILK
ncbi:hypothetical protein [Brachyspira innocens]|uniref:hypothetical protein n=1 Tax=Brachyspira innocens TaxID=13264 RepID=UPI00038068E1|nr:hypothetical protein [Brachyspira innocens]